MVAASLQSFVDLQAQTIVATRRYKNTAPTPTPIDLAREVGFELDQWQQDALMSTHAGQLLLASCQAGKSTVASIAALHEAIYTPGSLTLIVSPSERQSKRLLKAVSKAYRPIQDKHPAKNVGMLSIELQNGSEIHALPGSEETIRGFSAVNKLIIDEAARVDDVMYQSVRPMLAVSGGELMAMTTAFGKRGWFYHEYIGESPDWHRSKVTAYDIPRIPKEWLAKERKSIGEWWFSQEYLCEFVDIVDQLYATDLVEAADSDDIESFGIPAMIPGGTAWLTE